MAEQLGSESEICVDRPGENGSVNIAPVTIVIQNNAELTILGEQEVCFRPHMSDWSQAVISLKFSFPSGGGHDKRQWQTKPVAVSMSPGKTTHLLLCQRNQARNDPDWDANGWHDMWLLLPRDKERLCAR